MDGTAWVGGSNLGSQTGRTPNDVLCYRPSDFKVMQKQYDMLKVGLEESKRLELNGKGISLTAWIQEIRHMVELRGFDTVFRICDTTMSKEVYLFEQWGELTLADVQRWVEDLKSKAIGDKFDCENLKLSAIAIRQSLGPELHERVGSMTDPSKTTGPEYFKIAVNQVSYMNASTLRSLSNELSELRLKDIQGESVPNLTQKITQIAREIEGSGQPPHDLLHLVSKPYTKGTDEHFKTHALNIYNKVKTGELKMTWPQVVEQHNLYYQDLVQSKEYGPAKGGKDPDSSIHAMIGAIDRKLEMMKESGEGSRGKSGGSNKRTCFNCGSAEHLIANCPTRKNKETDRNWRTVPPDSSKGESKQKVIDGVTYKWCGKCRSNKGLWSGGDKAHFTSEHRGRNDGEIEADPKGSDNIEAPKGQLAVIDEPLSFGFIGMTHNDAMNLCRPCSKDEEMDQDDPTSADDYDYEYPKGFCGDL